MNTFTRTLFNYPKTVLFVLLILSTANSFSQLGWTQVVTPNPSPTRSMLRGISGTSSSDIWAVGVQQTSPPIGVYKTNTLVLHWNGTGWQQYTTPNTSASQNDLHDVEMLSPAKGWACGVYNISGTSGEGILMKWDGTGWSHHLLPNPDSAVALWSLGAVDSSNVWVVGWGANKAAYSAHYNGSSWTRVPVPAVGAWRNQLKAVDGIAANDVWAVGSYNIFAAGDFFPLAMHWDGATWTNFPLPATVAASLGELQDVRMVSANDVWAIGHSHNKVLHYDGTSWTEVSTPNVGGALAVLSANNIWSVGDEITHWDGTFWTKTDSLTNHNAPVLRSAVALPNGDIWAAGRDADNSLNSIFTTLVYRTINKLPAFERGTSQTLVVSSNSNINLIDSLLQTVNNDESQVLKYSIALAPANGILTGLPVDVISQNDTASPTGINYKPQPGFIGIDSVVVRASVGALSCTTAIRIIVVNVLPALLGEFAIKEENNGKALLKWNTLSESNTRSFGIAHSTDGVEYKSIATVQAKGNSNSTMNYNYLHHSPVKGRNYYQITLKDKDEKLTVYPTRSVVIDSKENGGLVVLPNPVVGKRLNIAANNNAGLYTLKLLNSNGQVLLALKKNLDQLINTINLPENIIPGIYTLSLEKDEIKIEQQIMIR